MAIKKGYRHSEETKRKIGTGVVISASKKRVRKSLETLTSVNASTT